MKVRERLLRIMRTFVPGAISLTVFAVVWEIVATLIGNERVLPRFSQVMISFYELKEYIPLDIIQSLIHFGMGISFAFLIAFPLGMLMGWFRGVFGFVDPIVEILRPIPPLAWIPLAIAWFHLTPIAASFIIFLGAFFPLLINTYMGFRETPKTLIEAAKVLGCDSDVRLMRYVALPHALPMIATGMRVGMGVGWMCVVAAEMFGVSTNGLGFRMFTKFFYNYQIDYVIAYMILLGIISLVLDASFRYITGSLMKWRGGVVLEA